MAMKLQNLTLTMDPKKKFWLFKQSNHFCSVPWNHFEVFSNGDVKTCSKGKRVGNINQTPLGEILKSSALLDIKKDLLEDKFNDNCAGCHELSTGKEHYDLRNHYNPMFSKVNMDYNNVEEFKLSGVDLHWDNTCNFKCVYCNPEQSSLIAKEQNRSVTRSNKKNIKEIIDRIVENQYSLKEIYFSGGEPLLIKQNYELLSQLSNTDIPIRINSNISQAVDSNLVYKQLTRFSNVLWTVSAESYGEKFNYTRNGGTWCEFLENLKRVQELNHSVRVNSVWFVGSVATMIDTIELFATQYGITDFTVNQLVAHPYLHVKNAPDNLKIQARDQIDQILNSGLIDFKSNSCYNIARCALYLDHPGQPCIYKDYFDHLDTLRNTNWRQVFPELDI
jgi:MoaA/NifB/PqqE/SkfB family radical SAM enzyme